MATIVAIALFLFTALSISKSAQTTGTVVELARSTVIHVGKGPPPQPTYAPVVAFSSSDGEKHRFTAGWYATDPAYAVGDTVPVRYRRDDPQRAFIDSFAETWLLPLIFAAIGITFLLIGLFLREKYRAS